MFSFCLALNNLLKVYNSLFLDKYTYFNNFIKKIKYMYDIFYLTSTTIQVHVNFLSKGFNCGLVWCHKNMHVNFYKPIFLCSGYEKPMNDEHACLPIYWQSHIYIVHVLVNYRYALCAVTLTWTQGSLK